jgi:hypothetical protein
MSQRTHSPQSFSDTFTGDVESDFGNGKSYEWLRDAVLHAFNPSDDDGAEESIMEKAIFDAADFIADQPCLCKVTDDGDYDEPCSRCAVLGQLAGEVSPR